MPNDTSSLSQESVLLSCQEGVAEITLNRPDKLNSFTVEMHANLRKALDQVENDSSIRCVLLTGAGRGFSAGQDLAEVTANGNPGGVKETLETNYNPLILRLSRLRVPTIAAVNGTAAGAGANIALACDLVLAARSASFLQAFRNIGLVPDAGGSYALPRLIGKARAMGMCLLGEKISATEAAQWGLIWRCIEDAELMNETRHLAQRLAKGPTQALNFTRDLIRSSANNTLDEQLALELKLQNLSTASYDYQEGVRAFLEKRPPQFQGR